MSAHTDQITKVRKFARTSKDQRLSHLEMRGVAPSSKVGYRKRRNTHGNERARHNCCLSAVIEPASMEPAQAT
jgi:hypothetical protein